MKKEYTYQEGPQAKKNFEKAMKAIFKVRKPVESEKPKAKTLRKSANDKG